MADPGGKRRSRALRKRIATPTSAPSDRIAFKVRFEAVMAAAQQSGLLSEKSGRIGGRVSPALVEQAKRQTGISTDSELIAFALANVAVEDNFAPAFREFRGTVDADLQLGFD